MAFFGMAHLGPQNSFLASRKNAYTVALFTAAEFTAAFQRVAHEESAATALPLSALARVLDAVFHGPPPPLEQARVQAALAAAAGEAGALALEPFLEAIAALQAQPLEVDADAYAHYSSFDQLRAHKLRQVRPFHGPEETLRAPATGLQDIGFLAHEAKAEKRRIKNHCAETKFKSELIKAGIYV